MKLCLLLVSFFVFPKLTMASTHFFADSQIYKGDEAINEQLTGESCFISIIEVKNLPKKGLHCYEVNFTYESKRQDTPKKQLRVQSRITNYHRPEFPRLKTCATNLDGTSSDTSIYSDNTELLYNHIFNGNHKQERVHYDYFLTTSAPEKELSRFRVHILSALKEYDIDCLNLALI